MKCHHFSWNKILLASFGSFILTDDFHFSFCNQLLSMFLIYQIRILWETTWFMGLFLVCLVYLGVVECGRRGWKFGLFSLIIALVFCKIDGFLSSKALLAHFPQRQLSLTQSLKKSQWPHDSSHLLPDPLLLMLMSVSYTNIGQEFCYCCKFNPSSLHNLFPHDVTLPHFGYFHSLTSFWFVIREKA